MNIKRRLSRLENKPMTSALQAAGLSPPKPPAEQKTSGREFVLNLQAKLGLPLPEGSTSAERAKAGQILQEATTRLRANSADQSGFEAIRAYSKDLHRRYGSDQASP